MSYADKKFKFVDNHKYKFKVGDRLRLIQDYQVGLDVTPIGSAGIVTAFHEWELNLNDFKEMLLAEIGEEGIKDALATFKAKREERFAAGDKRTLYDVLKSV